MPVKIFSVELSSTPHTRESQQKKQELITKFEGFVNDFIQSHTNTTTTWLQSSDASSFGGSFTQLTAIVTYIDPSHPPKER